MADIQHRDITEKAKLIRESILEMLADAGSGHTAGPLGMADVFATLYFYSLKHRPSQSDWSERDRLILSNGHICPVYYAALAHSGYFPVSELLTLRQFGSRLQGHPHRDFLPMVETSSGPLGCGISQAVGMALADRIDNGVSTQKTFFCLTGDGELNEGNNWEAILLAAKERLHNVIIIIDRNNIQIDGYTENIMPLESLADKWRAFNWHTLEIDGHNIQQISDAIDTAKSVFEKPSVIIAHTIAGRGVPEIERDYHWHGKPPTVAQEKSWLQKYFGITK
jgi:transketolase